MFLLMLCCGFMFFVWLGASQLWVNEGLLNITKCIAQGGSSGAAQFYVDLILTPAPPYDLSATYSGCTFGVVSGNFSATSANSSGTNLINATDVVPAAIISGVGISQAKPITFTNTTGGSLTVNGVAFYDPTPLYPTGAPLLMNVQALPGGPVLVPPLGTLIIPVLLGDQSQASS